MNFFYWLVILTGTATLAYIPFWLIDKIEGTH